MLEIINVLASKIVLLVESSQNFPDILIQTQERHRSGTANITTVIGLILQVFEQSSPIQSVQSHNVF